MRALVPSVRPLAASVALATRSLQSAVPQSAALHSSSCVSSVVAPLTVGGGLVSSRRMRRNVPLHSNLRHRMRADSTTQPTPTRCDLSGVWTSVECHAHSTLHLHCDSSSHTLALHSALPSVQSVSDSSLPLVDVELSLLLRRVSLGPGLDRRWRGRGRVRSFEHHRVHWSGSDGVRHCKGNRSGESRTAVEL